ncbi:MAG: DUF6146 family protein [Flavobacteriaceae bacterium]|nr:DUF6146 family protein [Flavobacteriaceae bacterium]
MKKLLFIAFVGFLLFQCKTPQPTTTQTDSKFTLAKDSIEYDVIVTDIGYDLYLNTIAKPMNFYSQDYYEQKNRLYVPIWNSRVRSTSSKWRNVFEQEIDYDYSINYGLEVNYKLYNYFKFIEYTYKIKLL